MTTRQIDIAIRVALVLSVAALLPTLGLVGIVEGGIDLSQRAAVRTPRHANRLLRLRQRVRDARERITAALDICVEW